MFVFWVHPGESENTNTHTHMTQERCKRLCCLGWICQALAGWNLRLFKSDPSGLAFSVPEVLAHKLHMDVCESRRVGGPGLGRCALDGPGISLYHNYVVLTRIFRNGGLKFGATAKGCPFAQTLHLAVWILRILMMFCNLRMRRKLSWG